MCSSFRCTHTVCVPRFITCLPSGSKGISPIPLRCNFPYARRGALAIPSTNTCGATSYLSLRVSRIIYETQCRYALYGTWDLLGTLTICCILAAFILRMSALSNEFFLFHAQFFYALSAPFLLSRMLLLSQINATLGPMTQVRHQVGFLL